MSKMSRRHLRMLIETVINEMGPDLMDPGDGGGSAGGGSAAKAKSSDTKKSDRLKPEDFSDKSAQEVIERIDRLAEDYDWDELVRGSEQRENKHVNFLGIADLLGELESLVKDKSRRLDTIENVEKHKATFYKIRRELEEYLDEDGVKEADPAWHKKIESLRNPIRNTGVAINRLVAEFEEEDQLKKEKDDEVEKGKELAAKKKKLAKGWDSYVGSMSDPKNKWKNSMRRQWERLNSDDPSFKAWVSWYKKLVKTGKTGFSEEPKGHKRRGKHYSPKEISGLFRAIESGRVGKEDDKDLNEGLSRGSLYRRRYYGRY